MPADILSHQANHRHRLFLHLIKHLDGEIIDSTRGKLIRDKLNIRHFKQLKCYLSDEHTNILLDNLGIAAEQKQALLATELSLYELLIKLHHQEHPQISSFLKIINKLKPRSVFWQSIAGLTFLSSVAAGIVGYFKPAYLEALEDWLSRTGPKLMAWLKTTFSNIKNIMLVSIVLGTLGLLKSTYSTLSNELLTGMQKLASISYKLMITSMRLTAYTLSYLASGLITPIAISLFIGAELVDVFKSYLSARKHTKALNALVQEREAIIQLAPSESDNHDTNRWLERANFIRKQSFHQTSRQALFTRFVAATLTSVAVAVWCLVPGSLMVTVACITAMFSISTFKRMHLASSQQAAEDNLQLKLNDLYSDASSCKPNHLEINRLGKTPVQRANERSQLAHARAELDGREARVSAREAALEAEKAALIDAKGGLATISRYLQQQSSAQQLAASSPLLSPRAANDRSDSDSESDDDSAALSNTANPNTANHALV